MNGNDQTLKCTRWILPIQWISGGFTEGMMFGMHFNAEVMNSWMELCDFEVVFLKCFKSTLCIYAFEYTEIYNFYYVTSDLKNVEYSHFLSLNSDQTTLTGCYFPIRMSICQTSRIRQIINGQHLLLLLLCSVN